ncbi:MAG: hypothetical protein ACEROO_03365 [Candidatus Bathyarchaeota archaeon]
MCWLREVLDDLAGMSYQVAELAGWLGDGTSEVVGGGSLSLACGRWAGLVRIP